MTAHIFGFATNQLSAQYHSNTMTSFWTNGLVKAEMRRVQSIVKLALWQMPKLQTTLGDRTIPSVLRERGTKRKPLKDSTYNGPSIWANAIGI